MAFDREFHHIRHTNWWQGLSDPDRAIACICFNCLMMQIDIKCTTSAEHVRLFVRFSSVCGECVSQTACTSTHPSIDPSSAHVLLNNRRCRLIKAHKSSEYIRKCKQVTQTNALKRVSVILIPHAKYARTHRCLFSPCVLFTCSRFVLLHAYSET